MRSRQQYIITKDEVHGYAKCWLQKSLRFEYEGTKCTASKPKSGTSHCHAYATAAVIHNDHRYTLALTRVEYGEKMKAVVQRLLAIVRRRQLKVRLRLLDKGFFSVEVISYLKRAKVGFIIPVMVRGRKPKGRKEATGLRALRKNKNGYYKNTLTGKVGEKQCSTRVGNY